MRIAPRPRRRSRPSTAPRPSPAPCSADPVLPAEDGIGVTTVIFEPGGRTYWHRHEVAQVLLVTHGEGRLQSADGTGVAGPGDVAHIPAGEVHWHGAAPGSLLVHVAVSVGKTEWMRRGLRRGLRERLRGEGGA